jgi:predicted DNA-binding transcriptional regulator AlpA
MGSPRKMPHWPARLSEDLAATYLSTSKSTFRVKVANGEYPKPVREGGRIYWSRRQLDDHIANQFGHVRMSPMEDPTWADLR